MKRFADSYKCLSCLIGNLIETIESPCDRCKDYKNHLTIKGISNDGNKAIIHILDKGVFEVEGPKELLTEIEKIRKTRCPYD